MRMISVICYQKKQYSVQGVELDLDCECQLFSILKEKEAMLLY